LTEPVFTSLIYRALLKVQLEKRRQLEKRILGLVPLLVFLLALCLLSIFSRTASVHVSAVGTTGQIRVYWDAPCTRTVQSIDWGNMTLGGVKNFTVYVRNEGNQTCFLNVKTTNWQPSIATNHLNFSWSCDINKFAAGKVARGTLKLQVSPRTTGVSTFSFNIVFESNDRLVGDVNRDEFVGIDDLYHVSLEAGKQNYDPACDINNDGCVDTEDVFLVAFHYGEESRS
jgi:hypothetical protein